MFQPRLRGSTGPPRGSRAHQGAWGDEAARDGQSVTLRVDSPNLRQLLCTGHLSSTKNPSPWRQGPRKQASPRQIPPNGDPGRGESFGFLCRSNQISRHDQAMRVPRNFDPAGCGPRARSQAPAISLYFQLSTPNPLLEKARRWFGDVVGAALGGLVDVLIRKMGGLRNKPFPARSRNPHSCAKTADVFEACQRLSASVCVRS